MLNGKDSEAVVLNSFHCSQSEPNVVAVLRLRASEAPDRTAFKFLADGESESVSITYGELDLRAKAIGAKIQLLGISDPIALFFPAGVEFIEAFFGCLYAGRIAVPLPPPNAGKNVRRLSTVLERSSACTAMTPASFGRRIARSLGESIPNVVFSDEIESGLAAEWREPVIEPTTIAYLQYTSGSTSIPKGVIISHGNLSNNLAIIKSASGATPDDIAICWLPHFHDMGLVSGLLEPVFSGLPCVLMSPSSFIQKPSRWLKAISTYRATHSGAPNFAYDLCARECTRLSQPDLDLSSWRVAYTGAELIRKRTIDNFSSVFSKFGFRKSAFRPAYGLAESTLMVSFCAEGSSLRWLELDAEQLERGIVARASETTKRVRVVVSCGKIPERTQVRVVDPVDLTERDRGRIGEFWIAGPSVSPGYWEDQREVVPTLPGAQGKYLRTGDLGFIDDDELFVIGRLKNVIVVRGQNHYAEDIEATAASAHPLCRESGGVAFSHDVEDLEQLVVLQEIATRSPEESEVVAIQDAIRRSIAAEHGVLVQTVVLVPHGQIPRTSSGKIDRPRSRRALQDRSLHVISYHSLQMQVSIPPSVQPKSIRELLVSSLGIEESVLDPDRPLTAYGLDSLAASTISAAVENIWSVSIEPAEILASGTASWVERAVMSRSSGKASVLPCISSAGNRDHVPLSYEQERLWIAQSASPLSYDYNLAVGLKFRGELNRNILLRCLDELMDRHEVLRTRFVTVDAHVRQQLTPSAPGLWPLIEAVCKPEELFDRMLAARNRPFDLTNDFPVRAYLFRLGESLAVVVLVAHHIAVDARSLALLIQELATLYAAFSEGHESTLTFPQIDFADFAVWQRTHVANRNMDVHLRYWRENFGVGRTWNYLSDVPSEENTPRRVGFVNFDIPESVNKALNLACREHNVTMFMWFLAVFGAALFRLTGEQELVFAIPSHGRIKPELEKVIGFFAHPLPLRLSLESSQTFLQVLMRTREATLNTYAHHNIPFLRVLEILNPAQERSTGLPFQFMLTLLSDLEFAVHTAETSMEPLDAAIGTSDLDLSLTLLQRKEGFRAAFTYDSSIFSQQFLDQLTRVFVEVLSESLSDQNVRVCARSRELAHKPVVNVASTFRAEPLRDSLQYWVSKLGLSHSIRLARHNYVWEELINDGSSFRTTKLGLNVLLIRLEDWEVELSSAVQHDSQRHARDNAGHLIDALGSAISEMSVPCLVCVCPASPEYVGKVGGEKVLQEIEHKLAVAAESLAGLHFVTSGEVIDCYDVTSYYDAYSDQNAGMPYTTTYYKALATMIARRLYGLLYPRPKVIALDCDNTLWTGVCAEDGWRGIVIDSDRQAFQQFLLSRRSAGMLICLCSKNSESDVFAVIDGRDEMQIKRHHLAGWRINWQSKSDNIRSLSTEFGFGLNSFVLIDDDPAECARVEAECPDVMVLRLPSDSRRLPQFLKHLWALDIPKMTSEGRSRAAWYDNNHLREEVRSRAISANDFRRLLGLEVQFSPPTEAHIERVAELTQRTTQFNTRTERRTSNEIRELIRTGLECLIVDASDRFGRYGVVGVLLFRLAEQMIEVDTFLLSCRALGRGIEEMMLERLRVIGRQNAARFVDVPYVPSERNEPAHTFLIEASPCAVLTKSAGCKLFRFKTKGN